MLSSVSKENPVLLFHASGHAIMANEAAMKAAGISRETPDPPGGHIVRDASGNNLGVFEENAMNMITKANQEYEDGLSVDEKKNEWFTAIMRAQQHCLSYGITTFEDAGSSFVDIGRYKSMAEHDSLDLRLWVMLRQPYEEIKDHMDGFPIIRAGNDMFTCRALKAQMDGALGSFGAWLLKPYSDKPGFTGQNTTSIEEIDAIAGLAMEKGMQMCVHAIGDRGNREVLNVYEKEIKSHPDQKDLRWRIEHAQHLNPEDMPRFKELGIIASMQGIHCTSDAPFVVKRLGVERASKGAYAWRSLLDLGVIIANGTDAPVEHVSPFPNLYASVTRKRLDNGQVFYHDQAMTRKEALYSYTLGNAYAGFEEDIKGSLDPGKWADIVILSQNLLTCPEDSIPATKVLLTLTGGEIKYTGDNSY
jgi:predicted amidohydrolase YtcJ